METHWSVSDAPPEFIAKEMRGIVGVEIDVSRVEGKWKASQNRNDEDAARRRGRTSQPEHPRQ